MTQAAVWLGFIFLLLFAGSLALFTMRVNQGRRFSLRRIRAFDLVKKSMAQAMETGRAVHVSLGVGAAINETTADTLAALAVLSFVAEQSVESDEPVITTMADPLVMLLAQNSLRATSRRGATPGRAAHQNVRWLAPQPAAYAAGVMNILDKPTVTATVMAGNFGDEYLLMGETAARRSLSHVGGSSNPNTLPFIYTSAQETLLGEEMFAAGAYLSKIPSHIASLLTQDLARWLIILLILGSVGLNSLR
jgi:hypothetical protein